MREQERFGIICLERPTLYYMNRVNERLSMNDPSHYKETHDLDTVTRKSKKTRNLLQQRLDQTYGENIQEEKKERKPSLFFTHETASIQNKKLEQEDIPEIEQEDTGFVWENDLEIKELEDAHKEELAEKRYRRFNRAANLVIILLCIYVGFLIFGVAVTQYHYANNGNIEAQKLSVSDIREEKEYEKILAQYVNLRSIYQSVLLLDYQYDQNADEHMTIATEYEEILDDILKASTQIKALDIDSKYVQLQSMMLSWVDSQSSESIYTYCKLMSAGITENSDDTVNQAIQTENSVDDSFTQITSNFITLGENINGTDLVDIKEWSPEKYINEKINGKKE